MSSFSNDTPLDTDLLLLALGSGLDVNCLQPSTLHALLAHQNPFALANPNIPGPSRPTPQQPPSIATSIPTSVQPFSTYLSAQPNAVHLSNLPHPHLNATVMLPGPSTQHFVLLPNQYRPPDVDPQQTSSRLFHEPVHIPEASNTGEVYLNMLSSMKAQLARPDQMQCTSDPLLMPTSPTQLPKPTMMEVAVFQEQMNCLVDYCRILYPLSIADVILNRPPHEWPVLLPPQIDSATVRQSILALEYKKRLEDLIGLRTWTLNCVTDRESANSLQSIQALFPDISSLIGMLERNIDECCRDLMTIKKALVQSIAVSFVHRAASDLDLLSSTILHRTIDQLMAIVPTAQLDRPPEVQRAPEMTQQMELPVIFEEELPIEQDEMQHQEMREIPLAKDSPLFVTVEDVSRAPHPVENQHTSKKRTFEESSKNTASQPPAKGRPSNTGPSATVTKKTTKGAKPMAEEAIAMGTMMEAMMAVESKRAQIQQAEGQKVDASGASRGCSAHIYELKCQLLKTTALDEREKIDRELKQTQEKILYYNERITTLNWYIARLKTKSEEAAQELFDKIQTEDNLRTEQLAMLDRLTRPDVPLEPIEASTVTTIEPKKKEDDRSSTDTTHSLSLIRSPENRGPPKKSPLLLEIVDKMKNDHRLNQLGVRHRTQLALAHLIWKGLTSTSPEFLLKKELTEENLSDEILLTYVNSSQADQHSPEFRQDLLNMVNFLAKDEDIQSRIDAVVRSVTPPPNSSPEYQRSLDSRSGKNTPSDRVASGRTSVETKKEPEEETAMNTERVSDGVSDVIHLEKLSFGEHRPAATTAVTTA